MSNLVVNLIAAIFLISPLIATAQQCADGIDNNNNGRVDMADPYCRSPADNDESSFASGLPGDDINSASSLDCWFDGNSGSGDDGCSVHACCLIDGPCPANLSPQTYDPENCTVSQACIDACVPITKQDCDCFGCCNICPPGQSCTRVQVHPVISPTCTIDSLGDSSACQPCSGDPVCRVNSEGVFENGFEQLMAALRYGPK